MVSDLSPHTVSLQVILSTGMGLDINVTEPKGATVGCYRNKKKKEHTSSQHLGEDSVYMHMSVCVRK